jgi:hypothetical protein
LGEAFRGFQPVQFNRFKVVVNVLIDTSGSVVTKMNFIQNALDSFIRALGAGTMVQIGYFAGDDKPQIIQSFTASTDALLSAVARNASTIKDFSTDLYSNIIQGVTDLQALQPSPNSGEFYQKVLVLFTDGKDEAGRATRAVALKALDSIPSLLRYTIGLDSRDGTLDSEFLLEVGRNGNFPIGDIQELTSAFRLLAMRFTLIPHQYYVFGYCTAKRFSNLDGANNAHTLRVTYQANTTGANNPYVEFSFVAPKTSTCSAETIFPCDGACSSALSKTDTINPCTDEVNTPTRTSAALFVHHVSLPVFLVALICFYVCLI